MPSLHLRGSRCGRRTRWHCCLRSAVDRMVWPQAANGISMIRLTSNPIDYQTLVEEVRRSDCGGVVLFLGTVRDLTDGKVTTALDYEAYPGMAEKKIAESEKDTRTRSPVAGMASAHRLCHPGVASL